MTVAQLACSRSGHGERIVLLHGFTQTSRSWSRIAERLAPDHEVVAIDLPGHAGSSEVRIDLVESATSIAEAAGPGPAVIVGYSLGGRHALHVALQHPQIVRALVLVGATAGIEDPTERSLRRASDERLAEQLLDTGVEEFLAQWLAGPLFASLTAEAADVEDRLRNSAEGLAASLRLAGTGVQQNLWPRLGELRMPVLLLAGEHDEKFTALGRRMAAMIGADAEFELVPGAGHSVHLEQPGPFGDRLVEFLHRIEAASPGGS